MKNRANMQVKFGVNQLSNETPQVAKNVFRSVLYIVLVWGLIQHLPMGLAKHQIDVINQWAVVLTPLVHATTKFFGWDFKQ